MAVSVMRVREVRMAVGERLVAVPVTMFGPSRRPCVVRMRVMGIVSVVVLVLHRLVQMWVAMLLGEMQPDAQRHQRGSDQQPRVDGFVQQR
jgi:hypothetical protein